MNFADFLAKQDVGFTLAQRRRRCAKVDPELAQQLVFA